MRIVNLGSGSKGNSTFIQAGNIKILLDIGFSASEISKRLELINEKPENIDVVIIVFFSIDQIGKFVCFHSVAAAADQNIAAGQTPRNTCFALQKTADLNRFKNCFAVGKIQITKLVRGIVIAAGR